MKSTVLWTHLASLYDMPTRMLTQISRLDAGILLLLVALLLLCPAFAARGITLDVHLEFGNDAFFKELNDELHQLLPHDEIDLRNIAMPHVTLYMTSFLNYTLSSVSNQYVLR